MKKSTLIIMISINIFVFAVAMLALIYGELLNQMYHVIGIRIATLFVAFASFCSSSAFSLLIYIHNRTINKANNDANKRAELFRELQFASSNYTIIEFMDRMLIYDESQRYVDRYIYKKNLQFHMLESQIQAEDVLSNPQNYNYISLKIPFRIIEGKIVSAITFNDLKFMRDEESFTFYPPNQEEESQAYILYNENTKRNNAIINLVVPKDSDFFISSQINDFSKITIKIGIISLLGVKVKGVVELYFTNPLQIEGNGSNTYKINSSNFTISEIPKVIKFE